MYLSKLVLNLRSRTARRDLADRYELHRTLMSAFPERLLENERVLYRVEDAQQLPVVSVVVQSLYAPDWGKAELVNQRDYLAAEPQTREITIRIEEGMMTQFRLQANPTVKREGKRHALYSDDDLFAWLQRKGEQSGFSVELLDVRAVKLGKRHGRGRQQTWHVVQYDGVMTIAQTRLFHDALINGIGSAKAFGFGLLSIPYFST